MPPRLALQRSGAGAPLVLVHGFTQTRASWERVRPALPAGRTVVALDLPGHGGSAAIAVADLEEAAALVGDAGGRATYVGYSLGGRTCLTLALARPDLVEALVLIGATAGIADPSERATRRAADDALAAHLEAGGDGALGAFLDEWFAGPLFARLSAEQQDRAARATSAAGLAASLRSCGTGTQVPSWARLHELAMPVLCCAGEDDARFRALAEKMAAAIGANATVATIPGAGHAACFENPSAFGELLGRFLAAGEDGLTRRSRA